MRSSRVRLAVLPAAAIVLALGVSGCGSSQTPAQLISSAGAAAQSAASAVQSAAASLQSQAQSAASQLQSAASSAASAAQSAVSSAASAVASPTGGAVPAVAEPVIKAWWDEMDAATQKSTCEAYQAAPGPTSTASGGAIWARTSMDPKATPEQKAITGPQMVEAVSAFFAANCG